MPRTAHSSASSPPKISESPAKPPRATWSGTLRFKDKDPISVRLYSASGRDEASHLVKVHAKCANPLQQTLRCPRHGDVPDSAHHALAFELDEATRVIVTKEELQSLKQIEPRVMQVDGYLPKALFEDMSVRLDTHLYIDGEHEMAASALASWRRALDRRNAVMLVRLDFYGRVRRAIVATVREGLKCVLVRGAAELRSWDDSQASYRVCSATRAAVDAALDAIDTGMLSAEVLDERDDHSERLLELVKRKTAK